MPDLTPDIAQQAVEPVSSATDGISATGRPIGDLIAADQYAGGKPSAKLRRRGLRFTKILPSGPMPDCGRATSFDGGFI